MEDTHYLIDGYQVTKDTRLLQDVLIVIEHAITLTVNGKVMYCFQCSPCDLDALAIGFLYNEGFINNPDEIANIYICQNMANIDVWLHHSVQKPAEFRHPFKQFDSTIIKQPSNVQRIGGVECALPPSIIQNMIRHFLKNKRNNPHEENGLHISTLYDGDDEVTTSDIQPCNMLQKLTGLCLQDFKGIRGRTLICSNLINASMVNMAAFMGIPLIISLDSATSLALELALMYGISVIGYAQYDRYTLLLQSGIYSHLIEAN